jgi:hypothetical protein
MIKEGNILGYRGKSYKLNTVLFFDGVPRIILATYHMDIQISLKEQEFYLLRQYLYETQLRWQIHNSLN